LRHFFQPSGLMDDWRNPSHKYAARQRVYVYVCVNVFRTTTRLLRIVGLAVIIKIFNLQNLFYDAGSSGDWTALTNFKNIRRTSRYFSSTGPARSSEKFHSWFTESTFLMHSRTCCDPLDHLVSTCNKTLLFKENKLALQYIRTWSCSFVIFQIKRITQHKTRVTFSSTNNLFATFFFLTHSMLRKMCAELQCYYTEVLISP
jgi:hypothetical protein